MNQLNQQDPYSSLNDHDNGIKIIKWVLTQPKTIKSKLQKTKRKSTFHVNQK